MTELGFDYKLVPHWLRPNLVVLACIAALGS